MIENQQCHKRRERVVINQCLKVSAVPLESEASFLTAECGLVVLLPIACDKDHWLCGPSSWTSVDAGYSLLKGILRNDVCLLLPRGRYFMNYSTGYFRNW